MKLKPCPFCGSDDIESFRQEDTYWVKCWGCRSEGPIKETERKAVNAWNKRPMEDKFREDAAFYQDACRGM